MTDWNPAEMIGRKPRPLALSLYKFLITDEIWAHQRYDYGYRDLRSFPLLVTFLGMPYIDIRASFNSFIPRSLSEGVVSKLCDFYLKKLETVPASHDKVEFDIVLSCFHPSLHSALDELQRSGFVESEIREIRASLLQLTRRVMTESDSPFQKDLGKIEELKRRQSQILNAEMTDIEKVYWLLQDCRRYGTLPFAGLARAAFIATQFLRSFVQEGWMTASELNDFMRSLNTVANKMNYDFSILSQSEFLKIYGHLRPGTYDILSLRYDEAFEQYFSSQKDFDIQTSNLKQVSFPSRLLTFLEAFLKENQIEIDPVSLLNLFKSAIESREYAKFIFSKSISDSLVLIEKIGSKNNLNRDEMSFCDVASLIDLYASLRPESVNEILGSNIARNREAYDFTATIQLPHLITQPNEVFFFEIPTDEPNFVTLGRFCGEIVSGEDILKKDLRGKIVMIECADPGYDWLFSKNIGALVTMYGGSNSHMSVRSSELGIPAVIGTGDKIYRAWLKARILDIDCSSKQVRVVE